MVNRTWMRHFGRGIVATSSNFGVTGERPTHPELLEYLAARFIENHWSINALHREIMLSATYQLGAQHSEPNDSADPENKLLWRANLRRLEVEALRDSLLFVSGSLDETVGGPPQELESPENRKRTVYSRIRRSAYMCSSGTGGLDATLQLFDFPDPHISGDQRSNTNVPLQGLFFLNSELVEPSRLRVADNSGLKTMPPESRRRTACSSADRRRIPRCNWDSIFSKKPGVIRRRVPLPGNSMPKSY
jgi:hypothetical protein